MTWDATAYCVTAIVCSFLIAGGINRAAYWLGVAIMTRRKEEGKKVE